MNTTTNTHHTPKGYLPWKERNDAWTTTIKSSVLKCNTHINLFRSQGNTKLGFIMRNTYSCSHNITHIPYLLACCLSINNLKRDKWARGWKGD